MSDQASENPSKFKLVDLTGLDPLTPLASSEIESLLSLQQLSFGETRESVGKISGSVYTHIDEQPYVTLPCKNLMPMLGLGTWKSQPGEVKEAVIQAVKNGYRHIDCAAIYQNEQEVGAALAEVFSDDCISRSDLFITSKLWNTHWNTPQNPTLVLAACEKSLKDLGLSQLDLYLIHWPANPEPSAIIETWKAMEALVDKGLVHSIGVSNFSQMKLQIILDSSPRIKPAVNQIECHPYHRNTDLLNFCALNDIHVTAYSPLGSPDSAGIMKRDPNATGPMTDPVVIEVAKKMGKTNAQVLIRWAIQRGTSVLPKSVKAERLASNIDVFGWTLSPESMKAVSTLKHQERMVAGQFLVESRSYKSLPSLWDEEELEKEEPSSSKSRL